MRGKLKTFLDVANVELPKMFFDCSKGLGLAIVGAFLTEKLTGRIAIALFAGLVATLFFGLYLLARENERKRE